MSGWNSKWNHNVDEVLARKGRRSSVVKIYNRIRSGSLPGWIGGGTVFGGGNGSQNSSQQQSPNPASNNQTNFNEQPGISLPKDMSGPSTSSTLDGEKVNFSSSSSDSTITTGGTVSTARCLEVGPNLVKGTERRSGGDGTEGCSDTTDYHDRLLVPPITSCMKNSASGMYPPSPASIESSPLTPRKGQFTIIPCSTEDPFLDPKMSKRRGNEALGLIVSALYGKLLVVMGIAFPMAEVISTYIPPSFYDGFYLYLYFGSITFMICIYGNILRQKATRSVRCTLQRINTMRSRLTSHNSGVAPDVTTTDPRSEASSDSEGSCTDPLPSPITPHVYHGINCPVTIHTGCESGVCVDNHRCADNHHCVEEPPNPISGQGFHFGGFYLRMGAVAFGIGSMIYSGLEFGQYFELEPDTKCHNFMIALTPAVRMIFTFMQMYFIFLNSKMAVYKLELGAQFGLMHMIGTNLCVWLNVLVQETRHEILNFYNPDNGTIMYPNANHPHSYPSRAIYGLGHRLFMPSTTAPPPILNSNQGHGIPAVLNSTVSTLAATALEAHHRSKRGLKGPYSMYECRRSDIMGGLVQNASPFLFPCTIEYSLICAAILYVMWKSMATTSNNRRTHYGHYHNGELHLYAGSKRSPHHYSVDCSRANKGLFLGIFVLVMTIISLILFFVLITRPGYQALAVLEVNITELVLYTTTTVAVLIGMCQMRELRYVRSRNLELDNILLIVAQTGSFIYNVFTIIGGHFTMKKNTALVLMTALSSLIQLLFQTLFILDASKRSAANAEQARRKPGREVVTFLLVTNLAMWAINTLEKSRADSHPVQLKFYGVWAWTIITHISMPLAIFYRFHSTVCLCEIWKRAYKMKPSVYR